MRWSTLVDILCRVCPKLTKLSLKGFPLETVPQEPHILSAMTTLPDLIRLNNYFPNLECINASIKDYNSPLLSSTECSVALSFKNVTLDYVSTDNIVILLPLLPQTTSLSASRVMVDEFSTSIITEAFKGIAGCNRFKELSLPGILRDADLRRFMQLGCFQSLEFLTLRRSNKEFLEAIAIEETSESHNGSEPSATPTLSTQVQTQAQALPVFLDTLRVLRLQRSVSQESRRLTAAQALGLNRLLRRMPRLEYFILEDLLPNLRIFDDIEKEGKSRLGHIWIEYAADAGVLTPEMITRQILDHFGPDPEYFELCIEGRNAIMKEPWAATLKQWFDAKNMNSSEDDSLEVHLTLRYR
ncbi:hypothetical protein BGX29_011410 [Mortierella sp. GBA35]|nr:hypothetical protein BGX29_011410 [Mortierella sp. GBA35]